MSEHKQGFVYLTRKLIFSSAHRLHHTDLDNETVYGQCANLHGHNYTLEVTVKGAVDPINGYVMDLKQMKNILEDKIKGTLDHKNLDADVLYFEKIVQSAENIAIYIWKQLVNEFPPNIQLYRVRLAETENNIVEYFG